MWLLLIYLGLAIVANVAIYFFVGQVVEPNMPVASLPAFLALFFASLWVTWLIAVKVTARGDESKA